MLPTGRADYYGTLPNLAARVSAMAAPGQVLVEASAGVNREMRLSREDSAACIPLASQPSEIEVSVGEGEDQDRVRMELMGCYLLKVGPHAKAVIPLALQMD